MSWETALDRQIHDYLPDLKWAADEPMAKHTSFRIGGPAKRMAFPKTREQLVVLMGFLQDAGVKPLLIGNGTNLLVADKGLDTVVIDTSAELSHIELTDEGEIAADAGVSLAKLALFAWKNGLTGLEFAHGIPGTLGGAVSMNAGAYGGELKDVVTEVTALYPDGVKVLTPAELDFSYRHSVFSAGEGIVLGAKVKLESGDPDAIKAKMDDLMARRKASRGQHVQAPDGLLCRPADRGLRPQRLPRRRGRGIKQARGLRRERRRRDLHRCARPHRKGTEDRLRRARRDAGAGGQDHPVRKERQRWKF